MLFIIIPAEPELELSTKFILRWVGSIPPTHTNFLLCGQMNKMATETEGGTSIVRRNRPGTKAKDMYNWPDQDFNDMETVLAGKSFNLVHGTELGDFRDCSTVGSGLWGEKECKSKVYVSLSDIMTPNEVG